MARLTACDRLAFSTIANSKDIMEGLRARGLKVPTTANGIKNEVFAYAKTVKEEMITDIMRRISNGERFSISFDEVVEH